jgi:hypothetical protein
VIAILEEDGLAPIAVLGDVVRRPSNHDPCQSSHAQE